jgi:GT2 family glycosyltransferase
MDATKIAVLMTCFNRKQSTLSCLDNLMRQEGVDDIKFKKYLVDDGSTDSTGDVVRSHFSGVQVLQGDGELYWGGGMRLAFGEALKENYEFYLWLNDDSLLIPQAVRMMLDSSNWVERKTGQKAIITGAICDAQTKAVSYGGVNRGRSWSMGGIDLIEPAGKPIPCDMINGNCVLIPQKIAEVVGNISEEFTHRLGDYDYSLRAQSNGFSSWITPGYVGTCSRNSTKGSYKDNTLSLKERVEILSKGPTAIIPPEEWMFFIRRHCKYIWPIYWARTFIRVQFPSLWIWLHSAK